MVGPKDAQGPGSLGVLDGGEDLVGGQASADWADGARVVATPGDDA